ncbi:MAG: T9SS type A sorting domain-containing protein [Bacteroides sp.]|nr:T9SS type A sorting domain-containing protein [Bacteroides sp.]
MKKFLTMAGMMAMLTSLISAEEIAPLLSPVKVKNGITMESMPVKKVSRSPKLLETSATLQRLDSVVGFNSDGSKGSLQRFEYDDNGWWSETHNYYWDSETQTWGEPVQSIFVERMPNGYVLSEKNMYGGYGVRADYEYDDRNRGIAMINYSINPGDEEWTPTNKGEYIYDDADNIIEETVSIYDPLNGEWVGLNHNFATWDAKGRQTSIDSFYWNGTDWQRSMKVDYRWFDGPYDPDYVEGTEKERMEYRCEYMEVDGEWLPVFVDQNEFTAEGRVCSQSWKYYNREFDNYYGGDDYDGRVPLCTSWKSKVLHDDMGIEIENRTFNYVPGPEEKMYEVGYCDFQRQDMDNGDFIMLVTNQNHIYDEAGNSVGTKLIDKTWYAYNANGKKLWCYEEMPSYEGELIPMVEDKWAYDENGRQIATVSYDFEDGMRVPNTWVTMAYDEDGNQIEILGRENASGGLRPFGVRTRSSESITDRDYRIGEDDEDENWDFTTHWIFEWENGVQTQRLCYRWNGEDWLNNQGQNNYFDFTVPVEEMMVPEAYTDPYKIDYIEQLYGFGEEWASTRMEYYYSEIANTSVKAVDEDSLTVRFHDNTIYVYGSEVAAINVYDLSGQNVCSGAASELALDDLSKGVYIVKVLTCGGTAKSVKVYVK